MNKAFIFDFDGIIVDSEPLWEIENDVIFEQLYGKGLRAKLGPITGLSMQAIHHKAAQFGGVVHLSEFHRCVLEHAPEVYRNARITPGIQDLKAELERLGFSLGIVSTSLTDWIGIALKRLQWDPSDFKIILSLEENNDLEHKPSPDGYIHAMQVLGSEPLTTIIIEDSNPGIQAAKASGATVIGFKQNLIPNYTQKGADLYAENVEDVLKIVKEFKV